MTCIRCLLITVHNKQHSSRRNHQFDLLRIVFATLVLLGHAPELTDGDRSRELFSHFTAGAMSFGELAVDGFFLLSGFLIVQSWQRDPKLISFFRKRLLRIVPGYIVAVLSSVVVLGVLVPCTPGFFGHLRLKFVESVLSLSSPDTPPVFPGEPLHLVNGALWTIKKEFCCYVSVAFLGFFGLIRRRVVWLAMTVALFLVLSSYFHSPTLEMNWFFVHTGITSLLFRLTLSFFAGGCFYLFSEYVCFRPIYAAATLAGIIVVGLILPHYLETAIIIGGGYLLFYFGSLSLNSLNWMSHVPDISYGVYLYGWPVESVWIEYHHGSPWVTFLVSACICFILGKLSWDFVERPALSLRWRSTAPLPSP